MKKRFTATVFSKELSRKIAKTAILRSPLESCHWNRCSLGLDRKEGIYLSNMCVSSNDSMKRDTQKVDYLKDINMISTSTICVSSLFNSVTFTYSRLCVRLSKFLNEQLTLSDKLAYFFSLERFHTPLYQIVIILFACVV